MLLNLAVVALAAPSPSVGDELKLQWSAPASCPQSAAVRAEVDRNLARTEFGDEVRDVVIEGAIAAKGDGWTLQVRAELPAGRVERTVEGPACEDLAQAAGLIIAVTLDPLRVSQLTRSAPDPEPEPLPPPDPETPPELELEPVRPPPPAIEPQPEPAPRRAFDVRLGAVGEFGTLDALRGGGWLSIGLAWRWVRVDIAAQYVAPRRFRPFDGSPEAGVRVQQAGGAARGCVIPTQGALAFATCVGFEAGFMRGQGIGLETAQTNSAPWLAATLGPEISWVSSGHFGLWAAADATLHFVRPRWSVPELGAAAETRRVGFRLMLGPAARF